MFESPEGSGIICRDDLSEDRDVDELPDFCLPIPEPVATGHQVIQDLITMELARLMIIKRTQTYQQQMGERH